jgi:hypothetical protein
MVDQLSWSAVGEWLAGFVPEGPLRTAVLLVYGLCVLAAPFIYKYYLGVLAQGAQPEGSIERQDYDKLRASLAGGNLAAQLYAKWLTAWLDRADQFFGDAGMADRTLFPHAFGLKIPVPLWTPRSFDRCLYLALIYPVWTIFTLWAISGHVGPAEAALGLKPDAPVLVRIVLLAAAEFALIAIVRADLRELRKSRAWKTASIFMPFHVNNLIDILTDGHGAFALIVVFALLLSGALAVC